jgi:hypothetical protein
MEKHPIRPKDADSSEMLDLEGTQMPPSRELPEVIRVSLPQGGDWQQAKLHALRRRVQRRAEKARVGGKRRNLAIVCARGDGKSTEAQWAREPLAMLGVPVHDQVGGLGRDTVVPEDHVRLTTIHFSRGIEASRVVILDFANVISGADSHVRDSRIMSHISLSRGQSGTTIVAVDDSTSPHLTFIEELIKAYKAEG